MSANFNLNPLNFATLASFSLQCTLKIILELLTAVDMILDCENDIRVEIIRAICHYGEANNKYMHYYDETKESA